MYFFGMMTIGKNLLASRYDPDKLADMMAEQPGQVRSRAFSIMKKLGFFTANVLLDKQVSLLQTCLL
jgi:hypothetical protein